MKKYIIGVLLLLVAVSAQSQVEWPHAYAEPGIPLLQGYNYHNTSVEDGRGGMWYLFQNSYAQTDTIFVVHVDRPEDLKFVTLGDFIKIPALFSAGGSYRFQHASCQDGSGGLIIVSHRGQGELVAQRFTMAGQKLWGEGGRTLSGNFPASPLVRYSGGSAHVVWQITAAGSERMDVVAQRLDMNGNLQWGPTGIQVVQDPTSVLSIFVSASPDGTGGLAVSFVRNDSLKFQYLSPIGTRQFPTGVTLDPKLGVLPAASQLVYVAQNDAWYVASSSVRYGQMMDYDIFLHKVQRSSGLLFVPWSDDTGKVISKYPKSQKHPLLTVDRNGTLVVSWTDSRNELQGGYPQIFAQRWSKDDAPLWITNGLQVSSNYFSPTIYSMQPVAANDAYYFPYYEWNSQVVMQKLSLTGTLQWNSPVARFHQSATLFNWNVFINTGSTAVFIYSEGANEVLRAKFMDMNGYLGENAPTVDAVRDIINDQGRNLSLLFQRSWLESNPLSGQFGGSFAYRVFRGTSGRPEPDGALHAIPSADATRYLVTSDQGRTLYWEMVKEIIPHGLGAYASVLATPSDSGRQGIPWNYYMVGFGNFTGNSSLVWYSNIDSGYSVDNLPPYPPQMPAGTMANGAVLLHWKRNTESDLAGYEVYRGSSSNFIPDEQHRIAVTGDTLYRDQSAPQFTQQYYIIKAVDVNGNRSNNSTVIPMQVLNVGSVPSALPAEYALEQNYPNPFNPSTNISFALPVAGMVTLTVTDALGREAGLLLQGYREAGRYTIPFSASHLASGVYFCEIRAEKYTKRIKMNLVK